MLWEYDWNVKVDIDEIQSRIEIWKYWLDMGSILFCMRWVIIDCW